MRPAIYAMSVIALAALSTGCPPPPAAPGGWYQVVAKHQDALKGQVDGRWFTRTVYKPNGGYQGIELVYCPLTSGQPVVCRTAVVWEQGRSALLVPAGSLAASQVPVPVVAPAMPGPAVVTPAAPFMVPVPAPPGAPAAPGVHAAVPAPPTVVVAPATAPAPPKK